METVNVVAAVMIYQEGQVFATQRGYSSNKDGWDFHGGKIKEGETPRKVVMLKRPLYGYSLQ